MSRSLAQYSGESGTKSYGPPWMPGVYSSLKGNWEAGGPPDCQFELDSQRLNRPLHDSRALLVKYSYNFNF